MVRSCLLGASGLWSGTRSLCGLKDGGLVGGGEGGLVGGGGGGLLEGAVVSSGCWNRVKGSLKLEPLGAVVCSSGKSSNGGSSYSYS